MIVYIVQMEEQSTQLIPNHEPHRYVLGVFDHIKDARKAGKAEEVWREGRYIATMHDYVLGYINEEKLHYAEEYPNNV